MSAMATGDALRIAVAAAASFAIVVWTVPILRRIAIDKGMTDLSRDRWQQRPTPYLGGSALVAGALGAAVVLPGWRAEAVTLLLGALVLAGVGLVDDVRTVPPGGRVALEIVVAVTAFLAGARVELFAGWLDLLVTVCWFVVVTNAFNLLDNMDGGMASIATVVAIAIAVVALTNGQVLVGGLAVVVSTACVGFLIYNWHPATIMMGDAGSLFLGFMLAALALKLRPPVSPRVSVTGLLLLLSPALLDTLLVVISRVRAGRSILIGGTDHTSHRLMQLGLGPRETAAVLALATAVLTTCGVLVSTGTVDAVHGALAAGVPCVAIVIALLRVPVYDTTGDVARARLAAGGGET